MIVEDANIWMSDGNAFLGLEVHLPINRRNQIEAS